jgi:hypothetical protein
MEIYIYAYLCDMIRANNCFCFSFYRGASLINEINRLIRELTTYSNIDGRLYILSQRQTQNLITKA